MVEIKTPGELAAMREAGRVVARALAEVGKAAGPGVRLKELDGIAAEVIAESGAVSAFKDYHPGFAPRPFPAVICLSVNEAIVHGIPDTYRLRAGDLLSVDFGVVLDGWAADAAVSLIVGEGTAQDLRLIDTTRRALEAAIALMTPGNRLGDIGHAIAAVGRGAGYGIPADFGGHGIGRSMHEDPHVPNEARPGRGLRLRPGIALAIEPMFIAGGDDAYHVAPDGWTLVTADGSRAAHFEHSVAVTDDGPMILTLP